MDCSDGKQARKTGTSNALGLLFDHGCDATMTGALSIIWTKCARTGPCIGGFAIFHTASTMFYFATMEEFFVGGLY